VTRHNNGWKTLARTKVLAYTGMRPSQLMRLDVATHVAPYLDQDVPMVDVLQERAARHTGSRLRRKLLKRSDCSSRAAHRDRSRHQRSTNRG
jgi:hypothetical protein